MTGGLKQCQYESLSHHLKGVPTSHQNWRYVNQCFKNIFSQQVFSTEQVMKELCTQGNLYYCYLTLWLKVHHNINIYTRCPNSLYRGVWCTKTPGEKCSVLVKGPLWQQEIVSSAAQSERFSPDIDFPDDGNQPHIFLTCEQSCTCLEIDLRGFDVCTHQTSPATMNEIESQFQRLSIDDTCKVIKLPWKVTCKGGEKMYVYQIIKEDIWFYSYSGDSSAAYHQYLHM